jgi:hypothetical protein
VGSSIIGAIAALVVGGAIASATVVGLVSSQQGAPSQSPGSVTEPTIPYGSN